MKLARGDLEQAAEQGIIGADQARDLWAYLSHAKTDEPAFRFAHILYYLGGVLAIGAMTLFMTRGWEAYGGWGLFGLSLVYAGIGLWVGEYLLNRKQLAIPAGIVVAFVVALTPLAVYGLQLALGYWSGDGIYRDYHYRVDWRWLLMELATLLSGAILFWRYRLPFLLMPVAVTLWYMSMDLTPFLYGEGDPSWQLRKFVSVWFGLLMMLLAFWIDVRSRRDRDYSFWLYFFGVLAFWCGLSLMESGDEFGRFVYFFINLLLFGAGCVLSRRILLVFGGLGMAGYVGHLAWSVFGMSLMFPLVLVALGGGVICLGVWWQRHEERVTAALRSLLPVPLRELVERVH